MYNITMKEQPQPYVTGKESETDISKLGKCKQNWRTSQKKLGLKASSIFDFVLQLPPSS